MKPVFGSSEQGLLIQLHVQPGAASTGIAGFHNGRLKVRLSAKAVDGAANEALRDFLADYFRVSKSCVTLVHGQKSRHKAVLISGNAEVHTKRLNDALSEDRGS